MAVEVWYGFVQGWIGVVGLMAFGNTISCFRGHEFLASRLYTGATSEVTPLMGRLFGLWTLLAAVLRVSCAYDLRNRTIYNLTFFSFILAFVHFVSELYIYKSVGLTIGVLAPLTVSGFSIIVMLVGYHYLDAQRRPVKEFDRIRSTRDIPLTRAKVAKSH